jgi:tripartite-type tricarboxylate transporter receptor subunit TctC
VNKDAGVRNLDDVNKRKEPLVVGGTGIGTTTVNVPRAYKDILGANFKIITGYGGTSEMRAAMLTKELDAGCWQWSSVKVTAKSMLDQGTAVVFTQLGLQKAPELAEVENALERAKTQEERTMLQGLLSENSLGRSFVAPPGVPRERVQALRKAFMAALRDPKLQEEANKMKLELDPRSGEECQKEVEMLKAAPPAILQKLKKILTEP